MQVHFVERSAGPERLVCEAEIHFGDSGPLAGMKLVGFGLWRGTGGEVYVTFPSRAFGAGSDRRFFDFLRPAAGPGETRTDARGVKAWILEAYHARAQAS